LERLAATPEARAAEVPQPPRRYFSHMPLSAVALHYGKDISGFRILCVERSPYAKVLSWANMQLSYDAYRAGGEMKADIEGLKAAVDRGFASGDIRHVRNIDRYRGADGKVAAKALRYAALAEDFGAFVHSLGEPAPELPHAKKGLLSDRLDPREMLRPDQIERINALFAEEFAVFGYPMI
jgi:hypothetical protein